MGARPRINWEPIKSLFIRGKTAKEIGVLFDMSPGVIHNRSQKEAWGVLRKQLAALPPGSALPEPPKIKRPRGRPPERVLSEIEMPNSANVDKSEISPDAFSRALRLRNSDNFRERVISQADKALEALEKANVTTVHETDRFAEALTKVERIGARAYGYDKEGDHPIINIGILGTGSEYDPV